MSGPNPAEHYKSHGNYFEDFKLGQTLVHGVPRTITESDATLYLALTGSRFALHCAKTVAERVGFNAIPLDNLLVFHIAFGKTVNDISLNAVANLGYAEVKFHQPCFSGDTLSVTSEVIGLKENSSGKTGVVYVHSIAVNQHEQIALEWKRWVMVKKNDITALMSKSLVPETEVVVDFSQQNLPSAINFNSWSASDSDHQPRFEYFSIGDTIHHQDGMTINDSDHSLATRLYQNNARVHFNQHMMKETPAQKRLVYGGHVISICKSLSYNGLGSAVWLSSINAGTHCNPSYSGDTIYCQSEILDLQEVIGRSDLGLARIRMLGIKNNLPEKMGTLFSYEKGRTKYHPDLVLDLDYSVFILK